MITLKQLANLLQGELTGDPDFIIKGIKSLEEAREEEISFIESDKMIEKMEQSKAAAFIVPLSIANFIKPIIRCSNSRLAWAKALEYFNPRPKPQPGVHPTAALGQGVKIGEGVSIGAGVVIGDNVTIGDDTYIHPRVVIEDGVTIGKKVIIQGGAVIGSDGFGFVTTSPGQHYKIPHIGGVIIEDEVEIGANVCIDRGTMGCTIVKKGSKIDNLVHLGHNVILGEGCLIVAQVGISGSVQLGDRVIMAGQVGTVGHINIGSDTVIAGRGGVTGNVPPGSFYSGFPARPHKEQLKNDAAVRKLPEALKTIKQLQKRVEKLEKSE